MQVACPRTADHFGHPPRGVLTSRRVAEELRGSATYIEAGAVGSRVDTAAMNTYRDPWPNGYDAISFSNNFRTTGISGRACSPSELLDAQRPERRDAGGMPGGNDAREHRDRREQQDDDRDRQRVRGRDAIELARDEPRQSECRGEADQYPDARDDEPLAEDEEDDIPPSGAHRRPDAEFVGALLHRVGDDAVDADGREKNGEPSEKAEQTQPETIVRRRVEETLAHRNHFVDGDRRVHVQHDLAHGRRHGGRIGELGLYGEVHARMKVERTSSSVIR